MSRASGIGSWPGTDVREAVRMVRDELADQNAEKGEGGLPYLPELPARGPGADMVGRTAGLLVELPVDLQPIGWRFVDRPGRDAHRTAALLDEDLDQLAEAFDGYAGDLKIQVAGPWTLTSSIWLHRGERSVVDPGACREVVASLAEGVRVHVQMIERLVPQASLIVQLDEPALPAVLAGRLPTASGFGVLRAIDPVVATEGLREVLAAAGDLPTVIHCCDPDVPFPLLRSTGVGAVALDATLLGAKGWESVAATIESGMELWAGVVPTGEEVSSSDRGRDGPSDGGRARSRGRPSGRVKDLIGSLVSGWRDVGLPLTDLSGVTLTPTCGLAGLTPDGARDVQRLAVDAARALTETAGS